MAIPICLGELGAQIAEGVMRIFQTFSVKANYSVKDNQTWYRNLYEPLVEMGHDVVFVSAEEGEHAMRKNDAGLRAKFSEKLLEEFKKENSKRPFDMFFSYFMDGMVEPDVIDQIRKTGVVTCNFSCNNTHQFSLVKDISCRYDFNLHAEKNAATQFRSIGANAVWWPMASNPKYFKPKNIAKTIDVSFVGANYAIRARYIRDLLEKGVNVQVYGPGWEYGAKSPFRAFAKRYLFMLNAAANLSMRSRTRAAAKLAELDIQRLVGVLYSENVHQFVSDEALVDLYSQSRISLGFLEVYDQHDPSRCILRHLHLRDFEAPMCGALYCTGALDELAEMFEPDREVLVYRDSEELAGKIQYYLQNPQEAEKIRRAGYHRALSEHTYQKRFEQLFETIGLSNE